MSVDKSKNKKKELIERQQDESSDIDSSDIEIHEPEIVEVKPKGKQRIVEAEPKEKKPVSEKKMASIARARQIKNEKLLQKRMQEEKDKKVIEKVYKTELEAGLTKTLLPKYEKQVKKQLLEKLKAKKLAELKKQYNYKSESEYESDSSDSGDSSSSEEEPKHKRKSKEKKKEIELPVKKVVKPVEKPVEKPAPAKPKGILQMYKDYGF